MTSYAKTILQSYKALVPLTMQIEEIIKAKAKNSFYNFSSTEILAEKILALIEAMKILIELKEVVDKALSKLSQRDKILIDYKYFGVTPSGEFDHTSRKYYRMQVRALKNFCQALEGLGVTKEWFENNCLKIAYISQIHKMVTLKQRSKVKSKKEDVK